MLVLSRKENETIHIGDNITLTVLSVRGGVVKLGINAPQGVRILRGELKQLDKSRSTQAPIQTTPPLPVPSLEARPHALSAALAV